MPLEWELALSDQKFTGPTNNAANALAGFQQRLNGASSALVKFEKDGSISFKATAASAEDASRRITVTLGDVIGVARSVAAALWKPIEMLDKFGDTAVSAFGERQGAIRAYTTLLGDATQAQVEFFKAQQLSQKTDLTSGQVEGAQKSLMVAGFRGEGLDQALLATADLGAMASPKEREMMVERSARALSQIFSKGKLQAEELRQLAEAGISRKLVLEQLTGSKYGKNAAAVEKSITGGKISGDEGIAAIERAILKQFGTSKLGEFAMGSAGSLTSMLSNRDEGLQNVLKAFDAEEHIPAVNRYKDALREQTQAFDLATVKGQAFSLTLQGLSNTSMEVKTTWTMFLDGFTSSFTASYNEVQDALGLGQEGWDKTGVAAKNLGATLGGDVGAAVKHLTHMLSELHPWITLLDGALSIFTTLVKSAAYTIQFAYDLIRSIDPLSGKSVKGAWKTFTDNEDRLWNPERYPKPAALPPGADRESGIVWNDVSPKVPKMAAGGVVSSATLAMIGEAGPEAVVPLREYSQALAASFAEGASRGGGGLVIEHMEIVVSGGGHDAGEVADEVWERFAREIGRLSHAPGPGVA